MFDRLVGIVAKRRAMRKKILGCLAYPTMLVLDRKGRIRYTHAGFSGPATGVHYDDFVREFTGVIEGLLAEA